MDAWKSQLAARGCRITAAREAVVGVLQQAESPLAPHEIRDRAEALHEGLGLVTVYRTLELLAELGLVRRVHREDGCHGYLPATQGHHHALICRLCGRSVEFPGQENLEALIRHVEAQTGYHVQGHLLQLSGTCPDCQECTP